MLMVSAYLFLRSEYPATRPDTGQEQDGSGNIPSEGERPVDPAETVVPKDKRLDLSNENLDKIPSYVFNMTELEELDVSHNNLSSAIQAEIRQLRNLKVLRANDNQMTGVPAEIGQLGKLEILDLSDNRLTGLPNELGNLKNLQVMDLSGNAYSEQDLAGIRQKLPDTEFILE